MVVIFICEGDPLHVPSWPGRMYLHFREKRRGLMILTCVAYEALLEPRRDACSLEGFSGNCCVVITVWTCYA